MFKPCFPDPPFFSKFVLRFYREFGIGGISKCTKHAFRLWFARVGVFIDRHFYRKRPPIEMIEQIEMIEMMEMIWDRLARDTLRGGPGGGVQLVISWLWEVSARAMGMVFADGLGDFAKCSSLVFRISLVFSKFVFQF